MIINLLKVYKYFLIYGFSRTVIKIAGRKRYIILQYFFPKIFFKKKRNISLIGCGQFGFSTISFFLLKKNGNHFLDCYDIDIMNNISTSNFWGYHQRSSSDEIFSNISCKYVYIASNHFSHTEYAISALKSNKIVYVEKPVCVNYKQFIDFFSIARLINQDGSRIYVGYNRPFSKAIITLNKYISDIQLPITLNCFIIGHFIDKEHWYRNSIEGTRICGNVGHWIDLMINIMNTRGKIPNNFHVRISYSNIEEIDDNISITMTTEYNDLISIIITSRSEPFEGINESIQFQSGNINAKIDDFRKIDIWNDSKKRTYNFFPKDVGHYLAINQPFNKIKRDFKEIEISTIIMLEIKEMVLNHDNERFICPNKIITNLIP
jgi:predicted dehydrogenase